MDDMMVRWWSGWVVEFGDDDAVIRCWICIGPRRWLSMLCIVIAIVVSGRDHSDFLHNFLTIRTVHLLQGWYIHHVDSVLVLGCSIRFCVFGCCFVILFNPVAYEDETGSGVARLLTDVMSVCFARIALCEKSQSRVPERRSDEFEGHQRIS